MPKARENVNLKWNDLTPDFETVRLTCGFKTASNARQM